MVLHYNNTIIIINVSKILLNSFFTTEWRDML